MSLPPVHANRRLVHSSGAVGGLVRDTARPLAAGLLLLGLLLVYGTVVQGSVRRGEQLNRQLADVPDRCDARAPQQRAPTCTTPADAGRSAPPQPRPSAAR